MQEAAFCQRLSSLVIFLAVLSGRFADFTRKSLLKRTGVSIDSIKM